MVILYLAAKNSVDANNMAVQDNFRMLKKAVQQGRSEQRGEAYASVR
jgi:hypothetical protein